MMHENEVVAPDLSSRREFLTDSAKLIGGGALAMSLAGATTLGTAQSADAQTATVGGDLDLLNYALTLEHLEYEFYIRVLNTYNESQFRNAKIFTSAYGPYLVRRVRSYFIIIRNHEEIHVDALTGAVSSNGGTPAEKASYNFGIRSIESAIRIARVLENTGVRAYDGAIGNFVNPATQTTGARIATVEARHASYLNLLDRVVPFPAAFDDTQTPREVCQSVIDNFITSAPEPYAGYDNIQQFCDALPNTTS